MVRCTAKANANYVGLTEDVVLGEKNNDEPFNSGRLTVKKDDKGNAITINKEDENGVGDGLVYRNEDGTVNKVDIYLDQGGTVIHNVAAGTADTDAVNVSQLNEAWDQINNNTTAITNIGNKVGELDSRIDEVGAGAAALAALHPLDFATAITAVKTLWLSAHSTVRMKTPCSASAVLSAMTTTWSMPVCPSRLDKETAYRRPASPWLRKSKTCVRNWKP